MDRQPHARRHPRPGPLRPAARRGGAGPRGKPGRDADRPAAATRPRDTRPDAGAPAAPGVDAFWLEADQEGSGEHPIERELGHRLDALARYAMLIEAALADGRERAAEILLRQREREEAIVRRLRSALRRARRHGG